MKTKRYKISGEGFTYVRPDSQGEWVKWEDVSNMVEYYEQMHAPALEDMIPEIKDFYKD